MKFIRANEIDVVKLQAFLQHHPQLDRKALLESGYIIDMNDQISGCFLLQPVHGQSVWLKQLYVTPTQARALPIVIEAILALAKQMNAKHVYANSHQPVVDFLLESLQFYPQKDQLVPELAANKNGKWWSYSFSP